LLPLLVVQKTRLSSAGGPYQSFFFYFSFIPSLPPPLLLQCYGQSPFPNPCLRTPSAHLSKSLLPISFKFVLEAAFFFFPVEGVFSFPSSQRWSPTTRPYVAVTFPSLIFGLLPISCFFLGHSFPVPLNHLFRREQGFSPREFRVPFFDSPGRAPHVRGNSFCFPFFSTPCPCPHFDCLQVSSFSDNPRLDLFEIVPPTYLPLTPFAYFPLQLSLLNSFSPLYVVGGFLWCPWFSPLAFSVKYGPPAPLCQLATRN